jgi:hypothetical protein
VTEILLTESTGNATVDQVLRDTVDVFEAAFPGRVRGYYVEGSYAGATGVATSDVDLSIVFVDAFQDGEAARARQLAEACRLLSAVELDVGMDDEAAWRAGLPPALKLAARLVYGTETRDRFPLVPLAAWTRDRMHTSYWRMVHLFGRPAMIAPPLGYPDPDDEFYGYLRHTVHLPDGREVPCTRDLIRLTGWAATGLLAREADVYVARKRDCHRLYRLHIGDTWTDLLDSIYEECRTAWHYLVPADPAPRLRLREICAQTLAFENSFLARYKTFLPAELGGTDPAGIREAQRVLQRIPYQDAEVVRTLAAVAEVHILDADDSDSESVLQ